MGGSKEYNWDDYKKFADKVGWRVGGSWLLYSELTFSEKHNTGHLPRLWGEKERQNTRVGKGGRRINYEWLIWVGKGGKGYRGDWGRNTGMKHFSLMWRPVNCNI